MPSLLKVINLSKAYRQKSVFSSDQSTKVLCNVSFDLEAAQILAIVGESGSGKSTLARQLVNLEQPDEGEVLLSGVPLKTLSSVHQKIRMVFQNPAASLNPHKRIFQILEEPLINLTTLSQEERAATVNLSLERVGLKAAQSNRYPHMFSGGQRQRVAIARALVLNPDVIVADEAVSALDVSVQAQILNLIQDLRDEMGMSWVFITHDLSVVKLIADRVLVLCDGRVVESGDVQDVMSNPQHPYTKSLLQAIVSPAA